MRMGMDAWELEVKSNQECQLYWEIPSTKLGLFYAAIVRKLRRLRRRRFSCGFFGYSCKIIFFRLFDGYCCKTRFVCIHCSCCSMAAAAAADSAAARAANDDVTVTSSLAEAAADDAENNNINDMSVSLQPAIVVINVSKCFF